MIYNGPEAADLPTAATKYRGWLFWIYDGADAADATTGGGGYQNLCYCDGASWQVIYSAGDTTTPGMDGFCRVTKSSGQAITNVTLTALTWDTEDYDFGACHSTVSNTSRFTAPHDGIYTLTATVGWANNSTGIRIARFHKNGVALTGGGESRLDAAASGQTVQNISSALQLDAADYVEVIVYQSSGGNLTVDSSLASASMTMARLVHQGVTVGNDLTDLAATLLTDIGGTQLTDIP